MWCTIARQFAEGFVILEGGDRLHELLKGMRKDPNVSLPTMCICAAALCRASGRFIEAGQTLDSLASKLEEDYASLPAIRKSLPIRVALSADSSMILRRQKKCEAGYHFDPCEELAWYVSRRYDGKDGNTLTFFTQSITIAIGGGSAPDLMAGV